MYYLMKLLTEKRRDVFKVQDTKFKSKVLTRKSYFLRFSLHQSKTLCTRKKFISLLSFFMSLTIRTVFGNCKNFKDYKLL